MVNNYDPEKPNSWILYLNANNLYGHVMSQRLPTVGFLWVGENEVNTFDFQTVADDPERLRVCTEWMSQYQIDLGEDLGRPSAEVEKIVPRDNTKYTLDYRNLKLYFSLGMRLTKIHRITEFNQSPWMAPYIACC